MENNIALTNGLFLMIKSEKNFYNKIFRWVMQCLQLALGMPESQAKKLESSLADLDGNQIKKTKLQLTEGEEILVTSERPGLLKSP